MSVERKLLDDGKIISVRVPMEFKKRGGRKEIILPEGARDPNAPPVEESALAISLARAHHWLELVETGQIASLSDISEALKMDLSYLARMMKLTLLAPDIKAAILSGTEPSGLSLAKLRKDIPLMWSEQRDLLNHHQTDPTS